MVRYCSVTAGTTYATEKGVRFHPYPRKKELGKYEIKTGQKGVGERGGVLESLSRRFHDESCCVLYYVLLVFASVFVSSSARISLARLGASGNLLIWLSFSPLHLNFFLRVIRVTSRAAKSKE